MRYSIILGTRPEIIKLSGIIRYLTSTNQDFFIIHTNQHYSENLDAIFFRELGLLKPKYNLGIGSGSHGVQTGKMLAQIEEVLIKEEPDVVIVQGDTNTVLAGALSSAKLNIPVAHVEAGLRSNDRTMPDILLGEGIPSDKIVVTGNTIVDAVFQNLKIAEEKSDVLSKLNLEPNNYILLTAHRAENTDKMERLEGLLEGASNVGKHVLKTVLYPIHPRTKKMIENFKINIPENIALVDPVGFLDFLLLQKNAHLILTDSGGVQEESCILRVPCVTLRDNTERPETVEVGGNILAGINSATILEKSQEILTKERNWSNPFGDGNSSKYIIDHLTKSNS